MVKIPWAKVREIETSNNQTTSSSEVEAEQPPASTASEAEIASEEEIELGDEASKSKSDCGKIKSARQIKEDQIGKAVFLFLMVFLALLL